MKRLCLFLDGTWDDASQTTDRLKTTNVWRLSRAVSPMQEGICNVVYYESGVGSETPGIYSKVNADIQNAIEGAFGIGLADKVVKAYLFVATNWQKGDEIYIFGFSRGAYTARLVAALIADLGLLSRVDLEGFPQLFDSYQKQNSKDAKQKADASVIIDAARAKAQPTAQQVPFLINFIGVFDTVGGLGIPDHFMPPGKLNYLGFNDTYLSPRVHHARHALALNETRNSFIPTKWTRDPDHTPPQEQTVKQCWFAGAHGDIGGGWIEGDLAYITQFWMVSQVHETTALRFDLQYLLTLPRPAASYGTLPPHNSITQGSTLMAFAKPHYRTADPSQHELFHASLQYQDLSKWDDDGKLRAVVDKAKLTTLAEPETTLQSHWPKFDKLENVKGVKPSPPRGSWGVELKKAINSSLYFWVNKDAGGDDAAKTGKTA